MTRLTLITVLVALATALAAAPGAQADVLSCATTGLAVTSPGHEAILSDLGRNGNDGLIGFGEPLTDTQNGIRNSDPGWEDGVYEYYDPAGLCLTVDTNGPADDGAVDTGLYEAVIHSIGAYDNTVCGTGVWKDRGAQDSTSVDLRTVREGVDLEEETGIGTVWVESALGPGEDLIDMNYFAQLAAHTGHMSISATLKANGEVMRGSGVIQIRPSVGPNERDCIRTDVTEFFVDAAFTVAGL